MSFTTTDLSDAHPEAQVCDPVFRDFGGRKAFHGPIKTLKLFDNRVEFREVPPTCGHRFGGIEGGVEDRARNGGVFGPELGVEILDLFRGQLW